MIGLSGKFAPLVTAFTDDTSGVSEIRLARLIRKLSQGGVQGYVVLGEVGQFTSIGYSDRKTIAEIAIREAQGLPVLVHVSTLSTMSTLDLAQHAGRHGARAAVVMPPYYGSYSQEEIEGFLKTVSQYADIPLIVVDPHGMMGPELRDKLSGFNRTYLANPVDHSESRPDSFAFEEAIVSPLNMLVGYNPGSDMKAFWETHGWNRVAKAALEELGVDCGPPRPPRQPLRLEACKELAALLAACQVPSEA